MKFSARRESRGAGRGVGDEPHPSQARVSNVLKGPGRVRTQPRLASKKGLELLLDPGRGQPGWSQADPTGLGSLFLDHPSSREERRRRTPAHSRCHITGGPGPAPHSHWREGYRPGGARHQPHQALPAPCQTQHPPQSEIFRISDIWTERRRLGHNLICNVNVPVRENDPGSG